MIKKIKKKVKKIILKINKKNKKTINRFSDIEVSLNINKANTNRKLQMIKYRTLYEHILKWNKERNIVKNKFLGNTIKAIILKGINFNLYFKNNIYYLLYKNNRIQ